MSATASQITSLTIVYSTLLVQIMTCRLVDAKPLSKPPWNVVKWTPRKRIQWHFYWSIYRFNQGNPFELSSGQWWSFCLGFNMFTGLSKYRLGATVFFLYSSSINQQQLNHWQMVDMISDTTSIVALICNCMPRSVINSFRIPSQIIMIRECADRGTVRFMNLLDKIPNMVQEPCSWVLRIQQCVSTDSLTIYFFHHLTPSMFSSVYLGVTCFHI